MSVQLSKYMKTEKMDIYIYKQLDHEHSKSHKTHTQCYNKVSSSCLCYVCNDLK